MTLSFHFIWVMLLIALHCRVTYRSINIKYRILTLKIIIFWTPSSYHSHFEPIGVLERLAKTYSFLCVSPFEILGLFGASALYMYNTTKLSLVTHCFCSPTGYHTNSFGLPVTYCIFPY